MAYCLQFSRGWDIIQTKAISLLPSSEGPSSCLLGNLSCCWHLSCSRCPPPLGEVCGVGIPAGITVLTVSQAMEAVAKRHSLFQVRHSSACGPWAKPIHVGHSLRLRKSKILEPALMAGAQSSSLSGGEAPACPWRGGWFCAGGTRADVEAGEGGAAGLTAALTLPCWGLDAHTAWQETYCASFPDSPHTQASKRGTCFPSHFFFTDNVSWILVWLTASGSFASPVARQQAFPPLSRLLLPDIFPLILMVTHLVLTGLALVYPENFGKGWLRIPIPR